MELRHIAQRDGKLSSFLRGELKMSSGLINRLKWGESLQVNGMPCRTNHPVMTDDVITVCLDEPEPEYPAQEGALTVLYEDDCILAADKPAGMLIHPSRSRNEDTLANYIAGYYRKTGQSCAFHPVTRLDRDTFGIVLLAKNSHIHSLLQSADVKKVYHAVTCGGPACDQGIIDAPIARRELPSLLRYVDPAGKPSVTQFTVLERRENTVKLELLPITGRTHQLRLHCAYMGFPVLGDPQYCSAESRALSEALGLQTQQLCAKRLVFAHPVSGQPLTLESRWNVL